MRPPGDAERPLDPNAPEELNHRERAKIEELIHAIDDSYVQLPRGLREFPESQEKCLLLLSDAEQALTPPISRKDLIDARLALTRLEIERSRATSGRWSFTVVMAIVYLFALAVGAAAAADLLSTQASAVALNSVLFLGVPMPIWIWGVIGSLTSMLLRAGQSPFSNRSEAFRWLLFRPIVGVVMGVMTYLMVIAGLIVFAGSPSPQTPELLWIIAFIGGFSDSLSINLLQKLLGRFGTAGTSKGSGPAASEGASEPEASERGAKTHEIPA